MILAVTASGQWEPVSSSINLSFFYLKIAPQSRPGPVMTPDYGRCEEPCCSRQPLKNSSPVCQVSVTFTTCSNDGRHPTGCDLTHVNVKTLTGREASPHNVLQQKNLICLHTTVFKATCQISLHRSALPDVPGPLRSKVIYPEP